MLHENKNWKYFLICSCILIVLMVSLSLWQRSTAWVKKYKIGKLVKQKEFLENEYQQLLAEKSKLSSYNRIQELATHQLNMHPYTSTCYFLNLKDYEKR